MRCRDCDNWIPDQAKFCQTCGNKVEVQRVQSKSRVFPILLGILILAIAGVMIGLLMERRKTGTVITQQTAEAAPPSEVTNPEQRETPKTSVKRVRFPRGRTNVVLRGSIVNDEIDQYLLTAKAGQEMMAHITSPKKKAKFDLYLSDDKSALAKSGAEDRTDWKGKLPASGDYVVSVHSLGSDTRYTLELAILALLPPLY